MKPKQIDQLKRARSGLRGWMTRDLDAVREIIESDSPDVTRVEEKLESITTRLHKAEDLQMEIEKLLSDDSDVRKEVDAQGPWFDMVTDRIHVLKLWLKEKQKQNTSEKPEKFEPIMPEPKPTSCTPKMKLPKTDLRKFSGEVLDWPEFWDIFRVSIHDNPEIPAVQKFVYLKSLLTDEAAGYVANIKTEEANYEVAVERLKSRYGKDEVQRNRLMSKLADMKSLDQSNKAMRDAVDELCATVRALEVQGVTTEQYGALLMPLIESKLPRDWRLEWAREKAGLAKEEAGLSKMLKFLERELDIRESADPSVEKELSFKHHPSVEKEKPVLPTASGLMAKPVTCTFCKGPHTPKQCTVPMSVEDRFKKLREVRACFRCARSGHRMSACRFRKPCPCGRGSHISQLCKTGGVKVQDAQRQPTVTPPSNTPSHPSWNPATPPYVPSTGTQNQMPPLSRPPQEAMMSSARNADFKTTGVMMRTVCVVIGNVVVRALCDTGATFTMMSSQLAASVPKRVVGKRHLRIETLGDVLEGEFDVVEVTARGENIASTFTFQAVVMDELSGVFERVEPECYQALQEVVGGCPILADLAGPGADDIGIVFGEDCYDTIVTGMTWKLRNGLKGTPTIFGWILHGGSGSPQAAGVVARANAHVFRATVHEQLQNFWTLDHLGVVKEEVLEPDLELEVKNAVQHEESGKYVVSWPWKPQARKNLALNEALCETRLRRMVKKMTPEEYTAYDNQLKTLLKEGHIEPLPNDCVPQSYLPHRGVVKLDRETTKLRIVHDASAKSEGGLSLNDALEKGPNLLPLLWGILLRFRIGKVGVVGDLEKAFLQLSLHDEDRNVCCFLWLNPQGEIEVYRYKKVFFGAKSSPFLLQVVLKQHLESFISKSEMASQLLRNLYMDDPVNSMENTEKAREFWHEAVRIFKDGGFNLRKFRSNDGDLLREFSDSQVQQIHKVLGVSWDLNSDELLPLVDVEDIVPKKLTKREVLSCLSKIYDPCGLVSPVVTPLKIIVQDCWKEKLGWDEEASVDLRRRVEEVLKGFSGGNQLRVNRWLGITPSQYKDTRVSLHVFTDASSRAYAAAAYLRVADVKGNITVNLVASKCRLAPPDGDTIPRLELLGALMGARLLNSLRIEYSEVLKIDDEFLWTDSSVALAWINQGPRVGGVFVANRVEEITAVGGVWSWVPTNENPADLPTRGMTVTQLSGSKIWWNGPEWLKRPETEWPKHSKNETGKAFLFMAVTDNEEPMYVEDIVDTPRTSKYLRTLRSVAWMLRWHKSTGNSQAMLSLEELNCAKTVILKQVQRKFFSKELKSLENGQPVLRQSCLISLHPFLDGGLIRMGGRLQQVDATFDELHPVLVKKCGVIDQLVLHIHEQMQHAGSATVISELRRQGIWILRSKKSVSSVLRKCRKCSRFLAAPASEQTPPLPRCRVTCKRPFETTGMDLGGPLYLKDNSKVWFVVFTCMSVRAIHLELVTSLSTEALIQALQRFMNRRGVPQLCISDHGSNFVAAAKWVREKNLDMKWQFVVERGPWWGGAWERLVGIVKGLLRRSLGHAVLTWEELVTALTEVEKVINCRPISYLWESANPDGGVPIPLCPEQFLLPPRGDFKEEERELDLSDEFRQRKMWLSSMNDLWRKEYLHQVLGSQGEVWKTRPNPLKVGEVVLVADDREKRLNWKMGVVRQLIIGRDGRCRAAIVQVKSGMLTRPVRKLYKLEICAESHNLPPITRLPEDADKDDEILDAEAEMTDGGEEAEHEVSMPQRTRSGREIVCPSRFRD